MADDPGQGEVVLFGGQTAAIFADTWTWNGTDWMYEDLPPAALDPSPRTGPPGTEVQVQGSSFGAFESVSLALRDSTAGILRLGKVTADGNGAFTALVTIPATGTSGNQLIVAKGNDSGQKAEAGFRIT
jgi:alpha-L-fucosidase